MSDAFHLRPARTSDVAAIRRLVRPLAEERILLEKEAVAYYESLQEFTVAEDSDGNVIGCGAVHVMWEDIAEVRTLATSAQWRGRGVGKALLDRLLERARDLGVRRVFCLTFEVEFFERGGFEVMADQTAVDPEVYSELLRSTDDGVAEFLDLARVKQNTLGNTRMILELERAGEPAPRGGVERPLSSGFPSDGGT
ncbi:amino-acid N-acetyltransferase [Zhihengliuella alba]|uniref:Amino-acid N-acetyltransferase n=1 Tax=Zhihengliuella alba TaxID=547018 RepID=A0ABP7DVY5_9MICC